GVLEPEVLHPLQGRLEVEVAERVALHAERDSRDDVVRGGRAGREQPAAKCDGGRGLEECAAGREGVGHRGLREERGWAGARILPGRGAGGRGPRGQSRRVTRPGASPPPPTGGGPRRASARSGLPAPAGGTT